MHTNIKKFKQFGFVPHLESFYSAPFEEKSSLKLDGDIIGYISNDLNAEFFKELQKHKIFVDPVLRKIEKDLNDGTLLPAYSSLTWLGDIADTFFRIFRFFDSYIIGFYDGKRIVIFIASLRQLDGSIEQEELFQIIVHEYMHKFAGEKSAFSRDAKVIQTLNEWYSHFIDLYFKKIDAGLKKKLMNFWTNIRKEHNANISELVEKGLRELNGLYNEFTHESDINKKLMKNLIDYTKKSFEDRSVFNYEPYIKGHQAYRKMGLENKTLIFQEFLIPSEVICCSFSLRKSDGNYALNKFL